MAGQCQQLLGVSLHTVLPRSMRTGRSHMPARPTCLSATRIDRPMLFSSDKQFQILRGSAVPSPRKRSKSTRLIDTPALTTGWLGFDGLTMQLTFQINSDTPSNFSRCCCRRGTEPPSITLGKPIPLPAKKDVANAARGRSRQGYPCGNPQHAFDKQPVVIAASAGIPRLAKTKRLHLRPLGVSQNESVHPKLESPTSLDENPESKQTLVGITAPATA